MFIYYIYKIEQNILMIMTQEDKELLLKDLCARLPYGVKVQDELGRTNKLVIGNADLVRLYYNDFSIYGENALSLPLLRPLSSMTDEELHEVQEILGKDVEICNGFIDIVDSSRKIFSFLELQAVFEWPLKNHFDYRGLIEKGLAIDATELNIY